MTCKVPHTIANTGSAAYRHNFEYMGKALKKGTKISLNIIEKKKAAVLYPKKLLHIGRLHPYIKEITGIFIAFRKAVLI